MLSRLIALALLSAFVGNSAAHAQVTVDVAKITCRQYLTGKITTPRIVAHGLAAISMASEATRQSITALWGRLWEN
jgi:hypothetical protein